MGFKRLCVCDVCDKKEESYAPRGWRTASQLSRDLNGNELHNLSALCCSDACERKWRITATRQRYEELR